MALHRQIVPLLAEALRATGSTRVGYPIPLVPLTCFWDGTVSQLRAYTPDELRGLAASLGDVGYRWNAGKVRRPGSPAHLTYLIGLPSAAA